MVELDRFQGPLDLLVHLIRSQDIDIFDIPISRITGQFLAAIAEVENLGLDRAGEFLEVAAMLVRIKLEMLLPRRTEDHGEQDDPRADLVRRLLEYEHYSGVARRLAAMEAERARYFPLGHVPVLPRAAQMVGLDSTWQDVMAAALDLSRRRPVARGYRVTRRAVSLEEKITLILGTLRRWARVEFRRLVAPYNSRAHTVVTFLAGLELARERRLAMRQRELFAPIWLYRRRVKVEGDADNKDH